MLDTLVSSSENPTSFSRGECQKNPKKCGNSVSIDGIYICKLELLPCVKVKQCPETVDFAELYKDLFSGGDENAQKE